MNLVQRILGLRVHGRKEIPELGEMEFVAMGEIWTETEADT
jgi:hypothetical protein